MKNEKNNKIAVTIVRAIDNCFTSLITIVVILLIIFGLYGIWDSNNVVEGSAAKKYEAYKPSANSGNFAEMQKRNPDTVGWLTIYGTNIDYPLMQGKNNDQYLNHDPFGNYSMTGSLFLDANCDRHFNDFSTIIYGHNMVPTTMFGAIKDFGDKVFFANNKTGNLFFDGKDHGLEILAFINANAYDFSIFRTGIEDSEGEQYINYCISMAVNSRDFSIEQKDRYVLLSTCSNTSMYGREILLARITDKTYENPYIDEEKVVVGVDKIKRFMSNFSFIDLVLIVLLIPLLILLTIWLIDKRKRRKQIEGRKFK